MSNESTIVGRINMKNIGVSVAALVADQPVAVARIFGKANGLKDIVDKSRGDFYEVLTGDFEAINIASGVTYRSPTLVLPSGLHELVAKSLASLPEDQSGSVDFGLEIRVVKADNKSGYTYQAVNLIPAQVVDPLKNLREQVMKASVQPAKK
jgi:hypothetical protein